MDFAPSPRVEELRARIDGFLDGSSLLGTVPPLGGGPLSVPLGGADAVYEMFRQQQAEAAAQEAMTGYQAASGGAMQTLPAFAGPDGAGLDARVPGGAGDRDRVPSGSSGGSEVGGSGGDGAVPDGAGGVAGGVPGAVPGGGGVAGGVGGVRRRVRVARECRVPGMRLAAV